jgi:multidrug efflux pump subunit AcrA (membrane-fusion protein)
MKLSSSAKLILMIAVVAVIGLLIGYAIGKAGGGAAKGKEEAKEAVTAEVKVVKAAEGTIEQSVAAYGSVIASPNVACAACWWWRGRRSRPRRR